ncbi:TetR/AcrR family transcriptional regulator [Nocardiopsis changdeensis]|uniref:TetR/AcrR family transcriptional regulator n=1 Tax=Nocardiopsis changdeensis TaxID=2831969 RepID=A0ABX8BME4_9ACTN|nr:MULTISPECIES: TetR/AcrR family transcriptional regulator [Nocardiopsis]QUX23341.1 TetR/AcrR family transcriptional regulator [Nocardiopsis changdeensis]QYX39283.1 TetR/AcrR family transcriptional regulator [Nocardiopsis sp. MT53]
MVRPARPEVRRLLIERAAGMLARRETVSLRGLVAGTGVSTMAVYTYFDGMPGLLGAVRQEGFGRLAARLAALPATDDPVGDLAAAGAAYAASARHNPDLYTLMFDGSLPLPDDRAADATLGHLVDAVERAVAAGRFDAGVEPRAFAHELWMLGHGACMLFATGVLSFEQVEPIVTSGLTRLYRAAGDDPDAAGRSSGEGWARGLGAGG